jgi:hypothetical protein
MRHSTALITGLIILSTGCAPKAAEVLRPTPAQMSVFKLDDDGGGDQLLSPEARKQAYDQVSQQLTTAFLKCPDKIWPAYNWSKMSILFVANESQSYIWRGSTRKLDPLDKGLVPSEARAGTFAYLTFEGQKAVSLKMSSDANQIFNMAAHEGFHHLGQTGWAQRHAGRGTDYPILAKPRLYRRMLFMRLKENFLAKNSAPQSLRKAAYWFNRWKSEFPGENLATADGYEGTARYVELMSSQVAGFGCAASDETLYTSLSSSLDDLMGHSISGESLSLDGEGYDIGSLAAFTLRFFAADKTWFAKMQTALTPVDILLQNVEPLDDSLVSEDEQRFDSLAKGATAQIATWIEPDATHWNDPSFIRIGLSSSEIQGSYSPYGFFQLDSKSALRVIPLADAATFKTGAQIIVANKNAVFFSVANAPCLSDFTALAKATDVQITGTEVHVNTGKVIGTFSGSQFKDKQGMTWVCPAGTQLAPMAVQP